MQEYAKTPGNQRRLDAHPRDRRPDGVRDLRLWDSIDAIKAFAGDDYETAVFYPEDDRYLVERDRTCTHWEVVRATG